MILLNILKINLFIWFNTLQFSIYFFKENCKLNKIIKQLWFNTLLKKVCKY